MKKNLLTLIFLALFTPASILAQTDEYNQINNNGDVSRRHTNRTDSLGSDKELPKGIKVC